MAPESSRFCHFPHQNLPFIDHVEDELIRDQSSTDGFHSSSIFFTPSRNHILNLVLVAAPIAVPATALVATNKLFKQLIRAYLESN